MKLRCLNKNQLQLIALITMLGDHFAKIIIYSVVISQNSVSWLAQHAIFLKSYDTLTFLGRITFPIFAFFIVEGFIHTNNLYKYFLRLFICATISEVPYDLAFSNKFIDWQQQNVIWTLLLGLICIVILDKFKQNKYRIIIFPAITLIFVFLGNILHTDWAGLPGILLIVIFYLFKDHNILRLIFSYILMVLTIGFMTGIELSFLLLSLYNGKKGKSLKLGLYLFYPGHLLALYFLQLILM